MTAQDHKTAVAMAEWNERLFNAAIDYRGALLPKDAQKAWLKLEEIALSIPTPPAPAEPLVRYCPGCGSVGEVEGNFRDCCPDGSEARMIPQALAEKCRDTFKLAVKGIRVDVASQHITKDEEQAAFEEWLTRECPSGDVESVQRQWEASNDYADLYAPPPQQPAQGDDAALHAEWMACETRRPWVVNSLRHRAEEMRAAEKRCRSAFRKDFMGKPATYVADAFAEAAAAFESRLAAMSAAQGDAA